MKKCINLANSTFNLYVLYIKLAQNTNQFSRLVLISIYFNVKLIVLPKFYIFEPFYMENGFHCRKVLRLG